MLCCVCIRELAMIDDVLMAEGKKEAACMKQPLKQQTGQLVLHEHMLGH